MRPNTSRHTAADTMTPAFRILTRMSLAALLAVGACRDHDMTGPDMPVSDVPVVASVAARSGIPHSLAYVSIPTGTLPDGRWAAVRVLRTGSSVTVPFVNGGFTPVELPASVGDRISIVVTGTDGLPGASYQTVVPPARAPVLMATTPALNATDVLLNTGITLQFNEPMSWMNSDGRVALLAAAGAPIAGQLDFLDAAHTAVRFVPAQPLEPGMDYQLPISSIVRDLDGLTVNPGISLRFTTWSGAVEFMATLVQAAPGNSSLSPIPVVVRRASGEVATDFNGDVTIQLAPNSANVRLVGPTMATARNGYATFRSITVTALGTGLVAEASAHGFAPASSLPFDVSGRLDFNYVTTTYIDVPMQGVEVIARGLDGAAMPQFTGPVTITLAGSGTLSGTTTVQAVAGRATFTNLRVRGGGAPLRLIASAAGFPSALGQPVIVEPLFLSISEPGTSFAGSGPIPWVTVSVQNQSADVIDGFTGAVTISLGNAGAGGILSGTRTVFATHGTAVFDDLWIDTEGAGYTLVASSTCCADVATSAPFDVVATRLRFLTQPSQPRAAETIAPAIEIAATGTNGETLIGFNGTITLRLQQHGLPTNALGTLTAVAVNGIAVFRDVRVPFSGPGFQLVASAPSIAAAVSAPFAVVGGWFSLKAMSAPRWSLGIATLGGLLYAVGGSGSNNELLSTVEAYDPVTNSWATRASLPVARSGLRLLAVGGKLYALGGWDGSGYSNRVDVYDPAANSWTLKSSVPNNLPLFGAGVVNGIIYVVGGTSGSVMSGVLQAYDPATNQWTTREPMPTPRSDVGITTVNGILYAIGGYGPYYDDIRQDVEAYDPATNQWSRKAPLPTYHEGIAPVSLNGRIYVVAGWTTYVDVYDVATDQWSSGAALAESRANGSVGVIGGVIYHVGGWSFSSDQWIMSYTGDLLAYEP